MLFYMYTVHTALLTVARKQKSRVKNPVRKPVAAVLMPVKSQ